MTAIITPRLFLGYGGRADYGGEMAPTPNWTIVMEMNFVVVAALSRGSRNNGKSLGLARALKTKMKIDLVDVSVTAWDTGRGGCPVR